MVRLYVDESVPVAIADGLKRRGVWARSARDVGTLGLTDTEQLQVAIDAQAAIFTHDDDFLKMVIEQRVSHCGVIYVHQQKYTIGECIRNLKVLTHTNTQSDLRNRIVFL